MFENLTRSAVPLYTCPGRIVNNACQEVCRCLFLDHKRFWVTPHGELIATGEFYRYSILPDLRRVTLRAETLGLTVHISADSDYFPGATWLVVLSP